MAGVEQCRCAAAPNAIRCVLQLPDVPPGIPTEALRCSGLERTMRMRGETIAHDAIFRRRGRGSRDVP